MRQIGPKEVQVGWFCEIDKSLKDRFDELYPQRGARKLITLAAIKYAIKLAEETRDASRISGESTDSERDQSVDVGDEEDGTVD